MLGCTPVRIRAVIFDCDGVLVDSVALAAEVLAEYLTHLGFPMTEPDARGHFGSGKLAESVARFERETGARLPDDFERELRRRRDDAFRQRLRPVAGALELVRNLRVPSAVASNGPLPQIELSLRVAGLERYFAERVFSAYTVRAWKPEPDLFLHAGRALGVPAEACAVIEDSELGIQAGVAAGMQVFAFLPDGGQPLLPQVRTLRHLSQLGEYLPADPSRC